MFSDGFVQNTFEIVEKFLNGPFTNYSEGFLDYCEGSANLDSRKHKFVSF